MNLNIKLIISELTAIIPKVNKPKIISEKLNNRYIYNKHKFSRPILNVHYFVDIIIFKQFEKTIKANILLEPSVRKYMLGTKRLLHKNKKINQNKKNKAFSLFTHKNASFVTVIVLKDCTCPIIAFIILPSNEKHFQYFNAITMNNMS